MQVIDRMVRGLGDQKGGRNSSEDEGNAYLQVVRESGDEYDGEFSQNAGGK